MVEKVEREKMKNRKMQSGELNHRQTHHWCLSCVIDDVIPPADLWPLTSDLLSSDQTLVSLEAHPSLHTHWSSLNHFCHSITLFPMNTYR